MKKFLNLLLLFIFCFISSSCNKQETGSINQPQNMFEEITNIEITNSQKGKKYKSVKEIIGKRNFELTNFVAQLKSKNNGVFENALGSPDYLQLENEARTVLQPINVDVLTYLQTTYPQFGSTEMIDVNDPDFVLFAQVYSVAEQMGVLSTTNSTTQQLVIGIPTWLRCTVGVIGGFFNVMDIINGLGTFEFSTVWKAVKSAARKYLGWMGAAILIYDITTQCIL